MIIKILRFSIVLVVVVLSVAVPFWASQRTRLQLSAMDNSLREQKAEITRLSDHPRSPAAPSLPEDQFKDLLRLRNQVGRLRDTVAETAKLRAALQTGSVPPASEPPGGPNYWPMDQLAYAGFASPESSLRTALWAMKNGDANSIISCMTPEIRATFEQEQQKDGKSLADGLENQFKQMADEMLSQIPGFRLVDEKAVSPEETTILLSCEGQGVALKIGLKKVGADWKIQDMGQPELYKPGQQL